VRVDVQLCLVEKQKGVGSRLTLISTGEIPLSPIKDPRMKLAAVGALAGGVLPVGLILAMSFMWRRYRYADEAEVDATANNVPLLGILPELKGAGGARDEMLAAAHSIHQVRLSLTARAAPAGWSTFMVTSGTAGEGKTSLTVALGLSFAVARFRTLVIDADLVGRQLSEHFGARGEEGFHEALAGPGIRNLVRPSGANPNLHLLPAGKVSDEDAYGLSAGRVRALIAEARSMFDVVLIDTGPILGSVEAGVLAGEVDSVIMVVSQGQRRPLVNMAVKRLNSLGARIAGLIFNRAKQHDFNHSAFGSSVRSTPAALPALTTAVG
jgi:capsular exopolysaccharide synthesis family protein